MGPHFQTHRVRRWVRGTGRSMRQVKDGGRWDSRGGLPGPVGGKSVESEWWCRCRWKEGEGAGEGTERCSSRLLAECRHLPHTVVDLGVSCSAILIARIARFATTQEA